MNRSLKNELCWWILTMDGRCIGTARGENLTDEELDSLLMPYLDNMRGSAVFFDKSVFDPQERSIKTLDEITADLKSSQIVRKKIKTTIGDVNDDPDEYETYLQIPGSIGVTKAITSLKLKNGEALVPPMNTEDWKRQKIQEYLNGEDLIAPDKQSHLQEFLSSKNITPKEMVDMEEDSWSKLTELGTSVHSVFEAIFGNKEVQNPGLPDSVYTALVGQINAFKQSLQQKYPGCKFYPEFGIKSKNLSQDVKTILAANNLDSINGIIDLLVIDQNGKAHIYDYKVSRKKIAPKNMTNRQGWDLKGNIEIRNQKLWASAKKLAAEYQTELYRQMVEQYGIKVADVNVLPVELDLEYNNADNPFEVTAIKGTHVGFNNDEIINDPGRSNNRFTFVKSLFSKPATYSAMDVDKAGTAYDIFFPKNSTIAKREDIRSNIEYYKQIDHYVHKVRPGETNYGKPGKEYKVRFPGVGNGTIYCSEAELDDKLNSYIRNQNSSQADQFLKIADEIDSIKSGGSIDNLLALFKRTGSFVDNEFKKYFDDSWEFVKDEGANSVGLFVFKKGDRAEVITLSSQPLRTSQNLGKGTSLLGKTKSDKNVDLRTILPALTGNMEMIKGMIYVSLHPEIFENCKISEVKCVNPWHGVELSALNSDLITSFNELVKENPTCGLKSINPSLFLDDRVALVKSAEDQLEGLTQLLENGGDTSNYYTNEWFKSKIDQFEIKYSRELDLRGGYQNTPAWNAYVKLREGWNLSKGVKSHIETDKGDYTSGKFFELNGLLIASPQFSASTNIRELGQTIDEFAKEVRRQVFTIGAPIQQQFRKIYDKYGTGSKVFDNWFADREHLILKDPDSSEFDGDPTTREALRCFLETMAKLRHPDMDLDSAKNEDDYYAIPLLEATFSRQVKNLNLFKALKNKFKENYTIVEGLFMGQEVEGGMEQYVSQNQELYNKLKYDNMAAREQRLIDYGPGLFETDLELVMNAALVAFCRSNVSKDYIPAIAGMKMALEYRDAHGSTKDTVSMANIRKRFDDVVKSKFYGESIVDPKLRGLLKFFNMIKSVFTTLTLSLNVRSFLRESLQGIYTGLSRAGVKMYPGITEKWYTEGLSYVIQEAHKNFSGVSLLQQLNAVYGMANQSLAQVAGQRRINWAHINHWGKDTLFLTATSPDFLHRMSLLIAKMKSDGCFDAHTLNKDGVLEYDFTKDKRFEHFVKGETSHEDYIKEKSLYTSMIDDFKRAGFKNSDGSELIGIHEDGTFDNLPQAYTRTEGQSIKNYADFLYGHYDDESRSLLCDTIFGSIFLQYKTFLTAKLEQWTMHEGKYNIAQLEQQYDDEGNPLYVGFYEDPDGTPHKDVILQSEYNNLDDTEKQKYRLYFDYSGLPMQGMLQESVKVWKSLLSFNQEKINEVWSDPTTRAMFKLQLHDLWLMMFMTALVTFIFGEITDTNEPLNAKKVSAAVRKMGPVENLTYNVITGSMADSQLGNIIASFGDKPPTIGSLQRFGSSSMKVILGDASIAEWLTRNVGMLRDFQGLATDLKLNK